MRRFERFLFGYGIFAITVFFISFGVFSPKPLNFISGVLLLPILLYFWIRLTNPEGTSSEKWSVRFVVVTVLLIFMGIYAFNMASANEPTRTETALKSQLAEALRKNEELMKSAATASPSATPVVKGTQDTGTESVADVLLNQQTVKSGGTRIMLKADFDTAIIYMEQNISSKKIGTVMPAVAYPFIEKSGEWYKVVADGSQTGWVKETFVDELR